MSPREWLFALHQLLRRPGAFFDEHPPANSPGFAAGVVFAVAVISTVAIIAVGWLLSQQIDATATVTVMEPWPETTCESFREMNNSTNVSTVPEQCTIDEPKTKQIDLGQKAFEVFLSRAPVAFLGTLFGWLLIGAGLHVTSALAGGEGSFSGTLAVAGVGVVPSVFQTLAVTGSMAVAVLSMNFGSNPDVVADRLRDVAGAVHHPVVIVVVLVVAAWQAWIWAAGLKRARDLDGDSAVFAAGVVAVLSALSSLL